MKDEIESYKIIEASIFEEKYFSIPYIYKMDKSKDSLYTTNYTYYPNKGVFVGDYLGRSIETELNYLDEEKLYNYSNLNIFSFVEFKAFLVNNVYRNSSNYIITRNTSSLTGDLSAIVNVVVQFTYKDGYTFISSRNYPIKIKENKATGYDSIKKELLEYDLLLDPNKTIFNWPMVLDDFLIQ